MLRPIKKSEYDAVINISRNLNDSDRLKIVEELSKVKYVLANKDSSILEFIIDEYDRENSSQRSYGQEAIVHDEDGADISVDLYSDANGVLYILELIRWDGNDIKNPCWNKLMLM